MSTSLLLTFDGTSGEAAVQDKSGTGKLISFVGAAALSSTQVKHGATSLRMTTGSDAVTTPSHPDFNLGTGDFTISAYLFVESFTEPLQGFFNIGDYGSGCLARVTATNLEFWAASTKVEVAATFTTNAFHHVEYCRVAGVIYFFLDGVLKGTAAKNDNIPAGIVSIGNSALSGTEYIHGYIDDLYVNKGVGLHTADFTPPGVWSLLSADLVGTPPAITAYGGGAANATPPRPVFYAGLVGAGTAELSAPSATATSYGAISCYLVSPAQSLTFAGSPGENDFTYTAPSPTLSAYTGGNVKLLAPSSTLTTAATGTNWVTADVAAPAPLVSASATVSTTAQFGLEPPSPNLIGYSGAVISITLTDRHTVQATGTTGSIGGARITAPLFELTSTATAQNYGGANLLAPSPKLGGQAQAWLVAPGATLTAVGTAVVTATYEAYALNLGHIPRRDNQKPTDETTRFTNFPFTHIVRYQNSYFGANSTGLYLLEGTTDNGTPIEWGVKTAFTDFDSAQLKTLEMAYFGGRMGPETAIDLYAGELVTNPYAYTTPRGATAQNYRQAFGRGQKARYYALGASGDDIVSIDSLTLNVATLARKV